MIAPCVSMLVFVEPVTIITIVCQAVLTVAILGHEAYKVLMDVTETGPSSSDLSEPLSPTSRQVPA